MTLNINLFALLPRHLALVRHITFVAKNHFLNVFVGMLHINHTAPTTATSDGRLRNVRFYPQWLCARTQINMLSDPLSCNSINNVAIFGLFSQEFPGDSSSQCFTTWISLLLLQLPSLSLLSVSQLSRPRQCCVATWQCCQTSLRSWCRTQA